MNLNKIGLVFLLGLLMSCSEIKEASLNNFAVDDDVFESGKSLVALTYGLHNLEEDKLDQTTLLIGVHGSNSRGYEWVYPLQRLNQDENLVSFYRWNDNSCPGPSVTSLHSLIKTKLEDSQNINKVIIVGHSYGGLLVASFVGEWDFDISLEAHSVAGPLKGMGMLNRACNYQVPTSIGSDIKFYQWRTIKELDGAFKDLEYDPQVLEIENSIVTRLPETYKGNKLGHNWSISWVADEIKQNLQ